MEEGTCAPHAEAQLEEEDVPQDHLPEIPGLGFGDSGLGIRVKGLGLGFSVWGLGCRVQG